MITTASLVRLPPGSGRIALAIRGALTPNAFQAALLGFSVLGGASGCTTYQPTDQSAEAINRDTTDYNNLATLLNIIRASRAEPLGFFTVAAINTTDSATANLGLPSIIFGPNLPTTPRQFIFGPNSVSRMGNNTVTFAPIDDPASYVALLAPVNPAIIGFLINQGYPREQLFFLFVDRLRMVDKYGTARYYINNPGNDTEFRDFGEKLADLLVSGLTAEVDANAVPNTHPLPASKLCFDPALPKPVYYTTRPVLAHYRITCDNAPWMEAPPPPAVPAKPQALETAGLSTCDVGEAREEEKSKPREPALAKSKPTGRAAGKSAQASGTATATAAEAKQMEPPAAKSEPTAAYSFVDTQGNKVEVYLRSTYGVYQYLGQLLRANNGQGTDIDNLLDPTGKTGSLLRITHDTGDCFVQTDYRDVHYCVPNYAISTKAEFTLLRQLVALNATPTNVPATTIVHVN